MKTVSEFIRKNTGFCFIVLIFLFIISIVLCIGIGPVYIKFKDVWSVMLHRLFGIGDIKEIPSNMQNIIWHLRAPRVLLGAMVGICLVLSGVTMQAFTRNPLADPYVLGISSGASFGAVLTMVTGVLSFLGEYATQVGAFGGAIGAIILVYTLSRNDNEVTPIKLILVGIAISAMFSAFTNYLVYSAPDDAKVREATFWMLGGVAGVKWQELVPLAIIFLPASLIIFSLSNALNAMMMGESAAVTLGINVNYVRKIMICVAALMTGVSVSVAGCIGFVGLVIPHVVRSIVGADHRKVISLSALLGGIFLIWVDVGARMLDIPHEIPIGILTSMLGAPLFLWMIKRHKYSFGG